MQTGTVKSFNSEHGYGFILPDDDDDGDIFVHARDLHGLKIEKGQRVGFNVRVTPKGRRALNIIVMMDDKPDAA